MAAGSQRSGKSRETAVKNVFRTVLLSVVVLPATQAIAETSGPGAGRVDGKVIEQVRSFLASEIVQMSVKDQNRKYAGRTEDEITELDNKWRKETEAKAKPLISATLSNPLSAYLTRVQANSNGLFTEIFVMDDKGMNVGQSSVSSDYWQGDEDKWQKTFLVGASTVFVDAPEFDADLGVTVVQLNMSVDDPQTKKPIGAATFQVNLTEMQRRR